MAPESPPPAQPPEFAEVDPSGRYGRYEELLGKGAFKTVFKAFDQIEGLEVAWNQVRVGEVLRNKSEDLERLRLEIRLLKTLNHKNIIKFYHSWVDRKNNIINFITEVFTSGTLRQYRCKHKHVDIRALKKWSRQILSGLVYLHSHDPPVIHRDLKCDNIFVNGNHGEVKIGDLGLARILYHAHSAHSVIGTPEFMAPELYEEEYNELVDIYAFGMCLLELVTFEYPYVECSNAAQIYKKVTSGIKPKSLEKVKDPEVRLFIEKCIANASERLPAKELLLDPFLQVDNEIEKSTCSLHKNDNPPGGKGFTVEGQRRGVSEISLKLCIADSAGQCRTVTFPFNIEADTPNSVTTEMVSELDLDLNEQDVITIAAMISSEIQTHVPEWVPDESSGNREETNDSDRCVSENMGAQSPLPNEWDLNSPGGFIVESVNSGRTYWLNSPFVAGDGSSTYAESPQMNSAASDAFFGRNEQKHDSMVQNRSPWCSHNPDDDSERSSSLASPAGITTCPEATYSGADVADENGDLDHDQFSDVTQKLVDVLVVQREELEDIRRRHEETIEDILKEVPPEQRRETLNRCRLKMYKS